MNNLTFTCYLDVDYETKIYFAVVIKLEDHLDLALVQHALFYKAFYNFGTFCKNSFQL